MSKKESLVIKTAKNFVSGVFVVVVIVLGSNLLGPIIPEQQLIIILVSAMAGATVRMSAIWKE